MPPAARRPVALNLSGSCVNLLVPLRAGSGPAIPPRSSDQRSMSVTQAAVIQLIQMMGLILKDVFRELGFSESQGATIMTTTQATSMALGSVPGGAHEAEAAETLPFFCDVDPPALRRQSDSRRPAGVLAGPLIRRYGFRFVAILGALLAVSGLALTSTATTFAEFMVYFSFMMGECR